MKKIIKQLAVLGVAGAMALNLGCDLEDVENPQAFAPASIEGKTISISGIGTDKDGVNSVEGGTITFTSPTAFSFQDAIDESTETGSYEYSRTSGSSGIIKFTPPSDPPFDIMLTFATPKSGTYRINFSDGAFESGAFREN